MGVQLALGLIPTTPWRSNRSGDSLQSPPAFLRGTPSLGQGVYGSRAVWVSALVAAGYQVYSVNPKPWPPVVSSGWRSPAIHWAREVRVVSTLFAM
jgi:hypothetical protein